MPGLARYIPGSFCLKKAGPFKTLPGVGAYHKAPRWQTDQVSSGSIFVFLILPAIRVAGLSSVLLSFGSHPLVFGFLQISLEGSLVSHADHPCLRVFIDMNNVICLLVGNEFIVGVFSKKSFFLGSIHVPFLETLILHYTALVLGMA